MTDLIINKLDQNREIFLKLLSELSEDEYRFRIAPDKWNLLEIVCHLYDEEQYDFRARVKSVLEDPSKEPEPIHPSAWVTERKYNEQDYDGMLTKFLNERSASIDWLKSLVNPGWENIYIHPAHGSLTPVFYLTNWLAHDYLHFRQIIAVKFKYLEAKSGFDLSYAGEISF